MILQTGGSAFGDISTKSSSKLFAFSRASFIDITPNCSPVSSTITRTLVAVISSLIRICFSVLIVYTPFDKFKN
jgi:hypothetical protein